MTLQHTNGGSADEWPLPADPTVLVFDVNETLIDFESLNPLFERIFGDLGTMREWLGHLIMYSMTATLSGLYVDYFTLGPGLLKMVGDIHNVTVTDKDADLIKQGMLTMPAHPDVTKGLDLLRDKGYRLVTLTNSPPNPDGQSPLEHAGLGGYFERQLSIEACRAYKPSPHVYHYVSQELKRCTLGVHDGGRSCLGHHRRTGRGVQFCIDHSARQRAPARSRATSTQRGRPGFGSPRQDPARGGPRAITTRRRRR